MSNDSKILYLKDIKLIDPDLDGLLVVTKNLAETTQTLVMGKKENKITLLTTNNIPNLYHQLLDKLEAQGFEIDTYFTDMAGFTHALQWYTKLEEKLSGEKQEYDRRHHASGEEAIDLIKETYADIEKYGEGEFMTEILRLSYQSGASDVHFQAEEIGVVMRIRKDGILQTILVFDHKKFKKYLMKIKYESGVKMNVSHQSQDGRFNFPLLKDGDLIKIDVRVSVMPGLRGESLVLRYLDASKGIMSLEQLGCEDFHAKVLQREIKRNYGLILVTGPTGSGKTTTVYSLLNAVNTPDKKIITLENPVEYELPGIEQSQLNPKKGYTFEEGLKGILRHDPDIIMVGEIRTLEAAEMAVNAALTGHLVISTIHTNSAVEALTRLLNMGVKPFMLASALNAVIGQRLLRKMSKPRQVDADKATDQDIRERIIHMKTFLSGVDLPYDGKIYQPDKRVNKRNDGYEGRTAVYEVLEINAAIKQGILDNVSSLDLIQIARKQGFLSLRDAATIKMLAGITSMEEILRVT